MEFHFKASGLPSKRAVEVENSLNGNECNDDDEAFLCKLKYRKIISRRIPKSELRFLSSFVERRLHLLHSLSLYRKDNNRASYFHRNINDVSSRDVKFTYFEGCSSRGKMRDCLITYWDSRLRFPLWSNVVVRATDSIPLPSSTLVQNWFSVLEFHRDGKNFHPFILFEHQNSRKSTRLAFCLNEQCCAVKRFPLSLLFQLSKTFNVNWDELWIRIRVNEKLSRMSLLSCCAHQKNKQPEVKYVGEIKSDSKVNKFTKARS